MNTYVTYVVRFLKLASYTNVNRELPLICSCVCLVTLSSQTLTQDDVAVDCCGRLSVRGDWHSCHSLFTFHLRPKVSNSLGEPYCASVGV